MELSSSYDFILFGDHPAGLWAASHLLSLDKKVLYIPVSDRSIINGIPKQILANFGIRADSIVDRNVDPIQILGPKHRFRIGGTPELIEKEMVFQFGTREEAGVPREFKRGVQHLLGKSQNADPRRSDWDQQIRTLLGTAFFDRNVPAKIEKMLKILEDRGLHKAKPGQLKRVFVDRGNFVGVQLDRNSKMIPSKGGIVASHYDSLTRIMSEEVALISSESGFRFEMRFECAPHSLPRGISSRMIFVDGDSPILELIHESPGSFVLRTFLSLDGASFDASFQRRLCERMIKVAGHYIPDLEYNLKGMTPDLRDGERAETIELPALYPYQESSQVPAERLVFENSNRSSSGYQSPVGNLFLANAEANPSMGLYGPYQSMVQFFEIMAKKKDSPFAVSSIGSLEAL
jgi:hypothetical protein